MSRNLPFYQFVILITKLIFNVFYIFALLLISLKVTVITFGNICSFPLTYSPLKSRIQLYKVFNEFFLKNLEISFFIWGVRYGL